MKRGIVLLLTLTAVFLSGVGPVSADTLIGWDYVPEPGNNNASVPNYAPDYIYVPGFSGALNDGRGYETFNGSTDGTYGSLAGPPNPTNTPGRILIRGNGANEVDCRLTISIINNTGSAYDLDELAFDFSRQFAGSPQGFDVYYIASLSGNSLGESDATLLSVSGLAQTGANTDFPDYNADISALADHTLENTAVAVFRIIGRDATGTGAGLIDNIAFTGTEFAGTLPATFITSPGDELFLNIEDAAGVVTGTVAVSYIEGTPPTNVTITSVSVVEQTHPGAFANLTSLPLTLASPSPAGDTVLIEFDNSTAGLVEAETASGVVEIIWNEVGSGSSSTSSLPVNATFLAVNDRNSIAIFDSTATGGSRLAGLVAQLENEWGAVTGLGSTDGTYGNLFGDAPTDGGCYRATLTYPVISIGITNNTGYDCILDSFHFDAAKIWAKGPQDIAVSISGDVTGVPVLTNYAGLTQFNGVTADYDDFDIDLTGLADRTLLHGEAVLIEISVSNGDASNSNAVTAVDNIALLGTGTNGAALTRVPGGYISKGISKLDLDASQLIEMFYTEGDAETNVVITGVSFSNETYPGAFSASGSFPLPLLVAGETNEICTVLFDNTAANVPDDDWAYALMSIEWNEAGLGMRTFNIDVYADNPADPPTTTNVIALVDTEFLTADAAIAGVKAVMGGTGGLRYSTRGSEDGTYGSISTNVMLATTDTSTWEISGANNVAELTFTNTTVADIELTSLHFDIGRWYDNASDSFTLSISGDVTADPALLVTNLTILGFQNYDFDDHDVDLTGLADHTLSAGESVVFTITLDQKPEYPFYNHWIDNVALLGDFDAYVGWADVEGVGEPGENPDGDNKDNLLEFSSGGDPLTPDGPAGASWMAEDGGTNWLYFVHTERQDDPDLSYGDVGTKGALVSPSWDAGDVEFVGASSGPGLFITVTNRTEAEAASTSKFIGVPIELD